MPDLSRMAAALRALADALESPARDNASKDMLSAAEFGERFHRSASWAKRLCRRGALPDVVKHNNGEWLIPAKAVAIYAASLKAWRSNLGRE